MATGFAVLAEDNALNGTEEDDAVTIISVLCVGEPFAYNVPSFPAFTAQLRAMKYEPCMGDGGKKLSVMGC